MYLTSDHAVYKTSDGGASWRALRQFAGYVQDIAVSPTDPNSILLAVQDEGLFRSVDGGASFALLLNPRFLSIYSVGMTSTVLYYIDGASFYRSIDNGQTWSVRPPPPNPIKLMSVDAANPDVIHGINPGQGFEVLRSVDGGLSWTARALPLIQSGHVRDLVVMAPDHLVVATDEGMYVSIDGGATWSRTLSCNCRAVAKDPRSPNALLTSNGQYSPTGQLYRSGDSGMTWSFLSSTPNSAAEAIIVRQLPSAQIVTANSSVIQRSADNGVSWIEADPGPIGYAALEFATTSAPGARLYAYSYYSPSYANGLFALDSSRWQRLNQPVLGQRLGQAVLKVKPGNPNDLFLAASGVGIFHSLDGGSSWSATGNLPNGNTFTFKSFEFDPNNSNVLYVGGTDYSSTAFNGMLYRSVDSGGSWSPYALTLPNSLTPIRMIVDPVNTQRRFVLATSASAPFGTSNLLRSIDGGQVWTQVVSQQEINDVVIHPVNTDYVFVAAQSGLLVSTNGGATFNTSTALALVAPARAPEVVRGVRAIAIDPTVPDTLYALTYGPNSFDSAGLLLRSSWVLRSIDRGQSWEVIRAEAETPIWSATRLALDPLNPAVLHVATGYRGVASYEIGLDLAATIVGHSGARAIGATSNFEIRVQNHGPFAATRVHVATSFSAGVTNVTGTGGGSTCTFANRTLDCEMPPLRNGTSTTILVSYVAQSAMAIQSTATVSALQRDIVSDNNVHTATATAVEVVDLSPTIVPASAAVNIGESLNFVVQASNSGPSPSSSATLSFKVPSGLVLTAVPSGCSINGSSATCNVGSLAAGTMQSFTMGTLSSESGPTTVEAQLVAGANATDANPTNNVAIVTTLIRPDADLSITVEDTADPVPAGNAFDYRVMVRNAGPQSALNVIATLTRTGGVSSTITSTRGGCANAPSGVRCDLGTIEVGGSALIIVTVASGSSGSSGAISLQASVSSNGNDRVSANDSAQASTSVQAAPSSETSGGGAVGWQWLLAMLCLVCLRFRQSRATMKLAIIVAAGWTSIATAGYNSWTMKGPAGGYVRAFASASNDNVIYALGSNSLSRSNDTGVTWEAVAYFDDVPLDMTVDPANSNRVYLSIQSRGVFRSDDGGRTYVSLTAGLPNNQTHAIAATATAIYRSTGDRSVLRSTDQGQTWTAQGVAPAWFRRLYFSGANANLILGLSSFGSDLHRSVDGGVTWAGVTLVQTPRPGSVSVFELLHVGSSSWVATTVDGIYTSRDDGATWVRTRSGYMGGGLAVDPNSSGVVLAGWVFPDFRLLRSTDSGATWSSYGSALDASSDQLIVHRTGRITVLGQQGVFFSTDGAATWNESSQGPVASYPASIVAAGGGKPRVYAIASSGLFHTAGDAGWQRIDLSAARSASGGGFGPNVLAVRPDAAGVLVTGNHTTGILSSFDGGTSWRRAANPAGLPPKMLLYSTDARSLFAYAPSDATLSAQAGGLFRSLDDGATWLPHAIDLPSDFFTFRRLVIDPLNPLKMYLIAQTRAQALEYDYTASLYRSTDGGIHWIQSLPGVRARDVAVHPTNGRVYVAETNGLQVSNDGGMTSSLSNPFNAIANHAMNAIAIDPQVPTTLYVASGGTASNQSAQERSSFVLRSVDDGQSWETLRVASGPPSLQLNQLVLDPSQPSILYAPTNALGVASFEVAPDLVVTLLGHTGERFVGQDSSFDLRADNVGPFAANDVRLSATLPIGATITAVTTDRGACTYTGTSVACSLGLMPVAAVARARVNYRVTAPAALSASATVTAHERDPEPTNNTARSLAYSGPVADLRVSAAASVVVANIDDALTYPVQVRNVGPTAVANATLTLTLTTNQILTAAPASCVLSGATVVCNTGPLAVAGTLNYAFRTSVRSLGTASVGVSLAPDAITIDPDTANNTASATVTIRPRGDLSVAIDDSVDPAVPGVNFQYRVVVSNAGPDALPNVVVTLINSGNTVSVNSSRGACTPTACVLGNLAANSTAEVTVVTNSKTVGSVSLRANVDSDGDDRAMINNSAREFTSVNEPVEKSSASESTGGGAVRLIDLLGLLLAAVMLGKSRRTARPS